MKKASVFLRCTVYLCVLGALPNSAAAPAHKPPIAEIATGKVKGVAEGGVEVFRGIPFAQPPVGDLRWRSPLPAQPWSGILDASEYQPDCAQPGQARSSEDCLYLNIFRPVAERAGLPVMVWVQGGSNIFGGASLFPGHGIAQNGVILVTFNYRVGRLGFFAHPSLRQESTGQPTVNFGHHDMLAALRWVQNNIGAFGGDPRNVTIFGESAGGGGVLTLLTQPIPEGLFSKAIVQSAGLPTSRSGLAGYTTLAAAEATGLAFAAKVGITGHDRNAAASLRSLPISVLVDDLDPVRETLAIGGVGTSSPGLPGATIDGVTVTSNTEDILNAAQQARISIIIGANSADLALGYADSKDSLFKQFGDFAGRARVIYDPSGLADLKKIRDQVFSDKFYVEPSRYHADLNAKAGIQTWVYRFSYVADAFRPNAVGASHASEIPFIFGAPERFNFRQGIAAGPATTDGDRAMAALINRYWINFASTGDPNGAELPHWPEHQEGAAELLDFTGSGPVFTVDPFKERLDLWRDYWDSQSQAQPIFSTKTNSR